MPPQTTVPSPDSEPHNPYDFIFKEPPKKRGLLPSGNSTKQRILIVVGGGLAIVAIFAIIFSILLSSGGGNTTTLSTLAQQQNELIRVSTTVSRATRTDTTANFSNTIQYSMISDQQSLVSYLGKHGKKLKPKYLGLTQSATTDKNLSAALLAGTYDTVANDTLKSQLTVYQKDIALAFKGGTKSEKIVLNKMYVHATALLKNAPSS